MLEVALLRPPGMLEAPSMARYADRVRQHAARGTVSVSNMVVPIGGALRSAMDLHPRLGRLLLRELFWPAAVRRIARGIAADVIHVPDHSFASSVRCLPGRRTVVTCHDIIPLETGLLRNPLEAGLYRANIRALRDAGRVIADSRATMEGLARRGLAGRGPVTVVPLGVDRAFFARPGAGERERTRSRLGLADRGALLLHVGNLAPYKNVRGVVETFAAYRREQDPAARLALAGPVGRRVRRIAGSAGVVDAVLALPPLTDPELAALYRSADALLFPSVYEGFGLPVLEAMASGLPVVVSDRGSLPEVVADGVPRFDPDDHAGMCAELIRLMSDKAYRASLITAGIGKARSFSWERCGAATAAVYTAIAQGGER